MTNASMARRRNITHSGKSANDPKETRQKLTRPTQVVVDRFQRSLESKEAPNENYA